MIFSLSQTSEFSIVGAFTEDDPVQAGIGFDTGSSFFDLDGPVSLLLESDPLTGQTTINQNITLAPGVYTLEIGSSGSGSQIEPVASSSAQIEFRFVRAVVPEPSSFIALLALSVPIMMRRRRFHI